jgi:ribosomal protein L11 methylase PrmA
MRARAAPGGRLVLSGLLTRQAAGVEAVYRAHGILERLSVAAVQPTSRPGR